MLTKHFSKLLLVLFATAPLGANATTLNYSGSVTGATGAFAALTPPGTPIGGDIEIDAVAVTAGLAGIGDVTDIGVAVGGFCFTFGTGTCAGAIVPITSIDSAAVTFAGGAPTGGSLALTAFSPTFGIFIPIFFDLDAGTFSASTAAFGVVDGVGTLTSAIPVPAAIWLMGSALLGLFGFRRLA